MKHIRPYSRRITVALSAPLTGNHVPKIAPPLMSPLEVTDGPLLHDELERLKRENEELMTELVLRVFTPDEEVMGIVAMLPRWPCQPASLGRYGFQ